MNKRRRIVSWTACALAAGVLFGWLIIPSEWFSRWIGFTELEPHSAQKQQALEAGVGVRMSSDEVMRFLGRNAISLSGSGRFDLRNALTNRHHVETQAKLLVGRQLYLLQTTNASLGELMIALSYYVNREVLVLGEPDDAWAGQFGPFDSTLYGTRYRAARGIEQVLKGGGWHVLRLTDGKLMLLAETDRQRLTVGKPMVLVPPAITDGTPRRMDTVDYE